MILNKSTDTLNCHTPIRHTNVFDNIGCAYDSTSHITEKNSNKGVGRLTGVSETAGDRRYSYGELGQLLSESYTIDTLAGSQNYSLSYQYDNAGQLTGITYPSGRTVTYTLNSDGQTTAIATLANAENQSVQTILTNATYLPFGPVNGFTFGNGLVNSYSYDQNYRLTSHTLTGLKNETLSYTDVGNISAITDPTNSENNFTFGYDKLSRLLTSTKASAADNNNTDTIGDFAFTYNAIGNRLTKENNATKANYSYIANTHHLEKITIDKQVQVPSYSSTFNQARRMASAAGVLYQYNYRQLRASKSTTENGQTTGTHYHYDGNGLLIAESDVNGIWLKEYIYFSGQLVAMVDFNNGVPSQPYAVHTDHLATPTQITNNAGALVWQATYSPFGLATINNDVDGDSNIVELNIRFPGQYYDVETGLHYNWNRYYDPNIGRYITSDPLGLSAGINTYGYVGGNPINYFDPNGFTKIRFNRGSGTLIIDPEVEGRLPYSIPATSGDQSCECDETVEDKGPIPVANYYLHTKDLSNPNAIKDIARTIRGGDWGDWRVPLTPTQPERLHGRSGFFLHGGMSPGSAGCVDIGGGLFGNAITDKVLQDILNDPDGRIPFRVRSN